MSPVQWTRGDRAGQVTEGSGDGDARIMSVMGGTRRNSSPSVGSEKGEAASSSASAEPIQQLGARPGSIKAELAVVEQGRRSLLLSLSMLGRVGVEEGKQEVGEFVDAAERGYIDNEFMLM